MPIDFDLLADAGTTNSRLRELFTAVPYSHDEIVELTEQLIEKGSTKTAAKKAVKEKVAARERDVKMRKKIEETIMSRMQEHVLFALGNYHFYSSVDLAWDSTPINKQIIPLMLYAQGRINKSACIKSLGSLADGSTYLRKDANGAVVDVDMPKFFETNINLGRSIITRRVSAQNNRYAGLYPWFKYESRATGTMARLRSDAVSQVADETCDQYGWRYTQEQIERDMLLYGTVAAFPAQSWDRQVEWVRSDVAKEFIATDKKQPIAKKSRVKKEGFGWTIPHPSRLFHDNNSPIWTLNTDSGCEYVGFWDVERYRDVVDNPSYFNRTTISYATSYAWLIGNDAYFQQYYSTALKAPPGAVDSQLGSGNDRKNNMGVYTGDMGDTSVFTAHYYVKVKPNEWGVGDYPYPIWIHLKLAGDCTVIFAEIMPSSPCAVSRFNASDNRMLNNSVMHELMGLQDQITNICTQILETAKADLFAVAVLNEDVFPDTEAGKKVLAEFKSVMSGKNFYASMQVLCCSFEKLKDLGVNPSPDNIFKIIRGTPNENLTAQFKALAQFMELAERMMNLSPQEQGQPASHEISATESQAFSNTTESVFSFISRSLDNFRAAQKRIFYESWMTCGSDEVTVPIINRYPRGLVEKAGFKILDADELGEVDLNEFMMQGRKGLLDHDYIFTNRDGADRANDQESAKVLGEVLKGIGQMQPGLANAVFSAMGKRKLFEWLNAIFRATGVDIVLELQPGEDDTLSITEDNQLMGQIAQLAQQVEKEAQDVTALQQQVNQILGNPAVAPNVQQMPARAA